MIPGVNIPALQEYFWDEAQLKQQFGVHDCVTFVVGALKVGWSRDFTHHLGYHDRKSAVLRLRQAGGLEAAITRVLGPKRPIRDLGPGSIIWFCEPDTVGLLMHDYIAVKYASGILKLDIIDNLEGWCTRGR